MTETVHVDIDNPNIKIPQEQNRQLKFPTTRYQGCKRRIINEIWDIVDALDFDSVIDGFGGTGVFAYKAKSKGHLTYYNDFLEFNHHVGKALIENDDCCISDIQVDDLLSFNRAEEYYPSVVREHFQGLYFTDEENEFLDKFRLNLETEIKSDYSKSIAISALAQAALTKRPFNLFHRANLSMRTNDVERSFGNKTTWEKSFKSLFRKYTGEYNSAIFSNGRNNRSFNKDILTWESPPCVDLAYFDPPYYARDKSSPVSDYLLYYHFLEGYIDYDNWSEKMDNSVKTKQIEHSRDPWNDPDRIAEEFDDLFRKFQESHIVVSYNTNSLPSPSQIVDLISEYKSTTEVHTIDHQYALNRSNDSHEVLILGY